MSGCGYLLMKLGYKYWNSDSISFLQHVATWKLFQRKPVQNNDPQ
jgi:hypothetical protein